MITKPTMIMFSALGMAAVLSAACGDQSIDAPSPLYVLVDDSGTLTVDVLNQGDYRLAGKIPVISVGDTPPSGAVAVLPGAEVLVTYTGVSVGGQATLTPNTVACSTATSQCRTIWAGWGSATALASNDETIAVPAWKTDDITAGKVGVFGGSHLALDRQVDLTKFVPGPVAFSPDGRDMYWLTYVPPAPGTAPQQQLLRVDATNAKVLGTVGFGSRLPYDLSVNDDGQVYVSVLFEKAPTRPTESAGAVDPGVYGASVEIFTPDLTSVRTLAVAQGPTWVATRGSSLLVASDAGKAASVGLYNTKTRASVASLAIPAGWQIIGVEILNLVGGTVGAVEVNRQGSSMSQLGLIDLSTGAVSWHELSGQSMGSVAA